MGSENYSWNKSCNGECIKRANRYITIFKCKKKDKFRKWYEEELTELQYVVENEL